MVQRPLKRQPLLIACNASVCSQSDQNVWLRMWNIWGVIESLTWLIVLLRIRIIYAHVYFENLDFSHVYPCFILYPSFLVPFLPPRSFPAISAEQYGLWLSLNLHYRALVCWGGPVSSPHSAAWHCPATAQHRHPASPPRPPLASPWSPLRSNELLNKRQALIHTKEREWRWWSRWLRLVKRNNRAGPGRLFLKKPSIILTMRFHFLSSFDADFIIND